MRLTEFICSVIRIREMTSTAIQLNFQSVTRASDKNSKLNRVPTWQKSFHGIHTLQTRLPVDQRSECQNERSVHLNDCSRNNMVEWCFIMRSNERARETDRQTATERAKKESQTERVEKAEMGYCRYTKDWYMIGLLICDTSQAPTVTVIKDKSLWKSWAEILSHSPSTGYLGAQLSHLRLTWLQQLFMSAYVYN